MRIREQLANPGLPGKWHSKQCVSGVVKQTSAACSLVDGYHCHHHHYIVKC